MTDIRNERSSSFELVRARAKSEKCAVAASEADGASYSDLDKTVAVGEGGSQPFHGFNRSAAQVASNATLRAGVQAAEREH